MEKYYQALEKEPSPQPIKPTSKIPRSEKDKRYEVFWVVHSLELACEP